MDGIETRRLTCALWDSRHLQLRPGKILFYYYCQEMGCCYCCGLCLLTLGVTGKRNCARRKPFGAATYLQFYFKFCHFKKLCCNYVATMLLKYFLCIDVELNYLTCHMLQSQPSPSLENILQISLFPSNASLKLPPLTVVLAFAMRAYKCKSVSILTQCVQPTCLIVILLK